MTKQSEPFLCMSCHKFAHTDSGAAAPPGPNAYQSPTGALMQRGRCTNCHFDIHGDDNGKWFTQ
jgi:hypothetical protein